MSGRAVWMWGRAGIAIGLGTVTATALLVLTVAQPPPASLAPLPWVNAGSRSWRLTWASSWARDDCTALISPSADGSSISASAFAGPELGVLKHAAWKDALVRTGGERAARGGSWSFAAFGVPFRAAACGDVVAGGTSVSWGRIPVRWPGQSGPKWVPVAPIWAGLFADILLCSVAWALALAVPGVIRRSFRRRRGECPACGYDLRGDHFSRCPECGQPGLANPELQMPPSAQ